MPTADLVRAGVRAWYIPAAENRIYNGYTYVARGGRGRCARARFDRAHRNSSTDVPLRTLARTGFPMCVKTHVAPSMPAAALPSKAAWLGRRGR